MTVRMTLREFGWARDEDDGREGRRRAVAVGKEWLWLRGKKGEMARNVDGGGGGRGSVEEEGRWRCGDLAAAAATAA